MAKKWPEKVIQRSLIKEHSFVNRLYIGNSDFSRGRKKRNNARKSALFRQEKAAAELFYDLQFGTTPEVTTQLTLWPIFMKGILNLVLSL